jgi:hypothetical protein
MRIVYDIRGPEPQVSGTGGHYAFSIVKPPEYHGFSAELLIVDTNGGRNLEDFKEGDAIYIEGDGEAIRKALTQALSLLDLIEETAREHIGKPCIAQWTRFGARRYVQTYENGDLFAHHQALIPDGPLCPNGRVQ